MPKAKDIEVRQIDGPSAARIIRSVHYSGKVVNNSCLHYGVFLGGKCGGALSFGPSLDKRKLIGLVSGTAWNGFIELNRMAFCDWLPRNSESRAIGWCMREMKKTSPHIEWVVSFADGTMCGDGTIYRASGFVLTAIKPSNNLAVINSGETIHKMTLESNPSRPREEAGGRCYFEVTGGVYNFKKYIKTIGGKILTGYQLRYLYFLNDSARKRLTVPVIPFSEIERVGAGMYKGKQRVTSIGSDASGDQPGEGGASPTVTLHSSIEATT